MHLRALSYITWLIVVLIAAYLRLNNLEDRPMHADEATGAKILAKILDGEDYQFNPSHFHGPVLSLTSQPIAYLAGEGTWGKLTARTLRLGTAIAGVLLVLTPLLWQRQLGSLGSLVAGALLATSPLLVYYSRMYIHEIWLALFGMIAVAFVFRFTIRPNYANALVSGLFTGLMFATKETFAITVLAWGTAAIASWALVSKARTDTSTQLSIRIYAKPAALLIVTAVIIATAFYSNGFRHPQGIVDAIRTYFVYETTPGHEKAFSYYLHFLLWPKHVLGQYWSEAAVATLALITCIRTQRNSTVSIPVIFLSIAVLVQFAIYSTISYKTPWLMLLPWAQVCLLAGFCLNRFLESRRSLQTILCIAVIMTLTAQTYQSIHANGRFANDARNPYAYVPSSKDLVTLEEWLTQILANHPVDSFRPIAVIGSGYWPLPWYLREFDQIGYWPETEISMQDYALVFAMSDQIPEADKTFENTHIALPRGVRDNVSMTLYLRNDIWEQWINQEP